MGIGRALITAINAIDAQAYGPPGKDVPNLTVELDIPKFRQILAGKGYQTDVLAGAELTANALLAKIRAAASAADAGDIFVVTYSGHGSRFIWQGQILNTMLLHDRMLVSKELHAIWNAFKPGARVVFVDASCASQSMLYWDAIPPGTIPFADAFDAESLGATQDLRVPDHLAQLLYQATPQIQQRYDRIIEPALQMAVEPHAAVVELAACEDGQSAKAATKLGTFFCYAIQRVLQEHHPADYKDFMTRVSAVVRHYVAQQSPIIGSLGDVNALLAQQPFQI